MEIIDIKSLLPNQINSYLSTYNQPKFRCKQIIEWLYNKQSSSFEEMTNLPTSLRSQLMLDYFISCPQIFDMQESSDGTRKYLLKLYDDVLVETVGIPSSDQSRLTVCFSTQAGCAMQCAFCATGHSGFTRNLTVGEMVDQIHIVENSFNRRVSNIVAMGQGEPFANYQNVIAALRLMNSSIGLGVGARHITVSTSGLVHGIDKFKNEPEQFTLAVSLHSAIQETRNKIMPGVMGNSLDSLRRALKDYSETTKRRASLEYAPINNLNDDDEHIDALIGFCRGMLIHVNLIPLNPIDGDSPYLLMPSSRLHIIEKSLQDAGIEVSIRNSRGGDIAGACGQLANKHRNSN